jgi:hypothetical protein
MTKKTFGDVGIALTSSIFTQIKHLPQKTQQFSGNGAIAPFPCCGSWRSLSPKQLQVLTRIEAKVGEQS